MGKRGNLSWFKSFVLNEKWKNHSVSAFQDWLQCNFWIVFTIFQNIKRIYEIFSSFISFAVDLFCFKSQWKLLILKAVHASIRPFHPPDIHKIWQNSQNLDWDIIERFPGFFYHYKTFIFHALLSMGTDMFISTIKCEIFLTGTVYEW